MIVVTRHQALVDYLLEKGIIDENVPVIQHVPPDQVRGQDVVGVLPLSLAALTNSITEVTLVLTSQDRGKELSLERVREIAQDPVTYQVNVKE